MLEYTRDAGRTGAVRAVLAIFMLVPLCACVHDKVTDWDKPGGIIASEFYADSNDC